MRSVLTILRRVCVGLAVVLAITLWSFAAFAQPATPGLPRTEPVRASIESSPLGGAGRGLERTAQADQGTSRSSPVTPASFTRTALALAGVLTLIGVLAVIVKKFVLRGEGGGSLLRGIAGTLGTGAASPPGVLEVLGRYPGGAGVTLLLLKLDRRVLLVSQSRTRGWRSGAEMRTLCELDQPEDVASILLKIRGPEQARLAARFEEELSRQAEPAPLARVHAQPMPARGVRAGVTDQDGSAGARAIRDRLDALRASPAGGRPLRAGGGGGA